MSNEASIQLALEDLRLQECHKDQQLSKTKAISKGKKSLTNSQEDTLIQHINHLAACGLSPTPQIIQNLVFEITKQESGIN
ncbi:hypothetical protein GX48_07908 [Paracoccidioides brasiliensis]|nr:hypothetical protein GX48_07908 [Paracoccidioides brasiliensis]